MQDILPTVAFVGAPAGTTGLFSALFAEAGFRVVLVDDIKPSTTEALSIDAAIVFDAILPATSSVKILKQAFSDVPIFVAMRVDDASTRQDALAAGAHDVFTIPLVLTEVAAKLRRVLRMEYPHQLPSVLVADGVKLDRDQHLVLRRGSSVHLAPAEYRLLEFLMLRPGAARSRAEILAAVWGGEPGVRERAVDVQMKRLREALNRGLKGDPISSVRGKGYSIRPVKRRS